MPAKKTTLEFIEQARIVHGEMYDYLLVEYTGARNNVDIRCYHHGVFAQLAASHTSGSGCPACGKDAADKEKRLKTAVFIERSKEIHGNLYDYSRVICVDRKKEVLIGCGSHGLYTQAPDSHLRGSGCPKCGNIKAGLSTRITQQEFITKANSVHGGRYDYSLVNYRGNKIKVRILCPMHGVFEQTPNSHADRAKGCPKCSLSKGELRISGLLDSLGVKYEQQKKFNECRGHYPLPYDFYLPEFKTLIEYDGKQHFEPSPRFGGQKAFKRTLKNDHIKTIFAQSWGYKLLRIKYTDYNNIESILTRVLGVHGNAV